MRFIIEWGPYQEDEGPNYREQQIEVIFWKWGMTIWQVDHSKQKHRQWFHSQYTFERLWNIFNW